MRKSTLGLAVILCGSVLLTGCDRVEPGEVGILVNKTGDNKGVGEVVGVGRVWTGWNSTLYTFPTFKQMKSYEEPFFFQMNDGTTVGYHMNVAYKVNPTRVRDVFQMYRKGVDDITNSDLQQNISDSLNRLASHMSTDQFIGGGKSELLDNALKDVQNLMAPIGIQVLSISYRGRPMYPKSVDNSINAKVNANQKTLQREQEVKQTEAEANMARAKAQGEADSVKIKAQGDADAIEIKARAMSNSIQFLPYMIQMQTIEKWNGQGPTTSMGNSSYPLPTINVGK